MVVVSTWLLINQGIPTQYQRRIDQRNGFGVRKVNSSLKKGESSYTKDRVNTLVSMVILSSPLFLFLFVVRTSECGY